jgi:hypothetical protein
MPDDFKTFMSRIESPALQAVALHWQQARGEKRMPTWADLSSSAVPLQFKKLWGFQYDAEAQEFRGWFAGDRLRKWVAQRFDGGLLRDLAPPASYEQLQEYLTKVISSQQIQRTSGSLFKTADCVVAGERIAFPVTKDGKSADGVFGASDFVAPALLGPAELVHENVEWYRI